MPVLPIQGKGRHKTSPRTHGEEARNYRGEEGGTAESKGRARSTRNGAESRRGKEKELELLVPEECQVLVVCGKKKGWGEVILCTVVYKIVYYMRLLRHESCGMNYLTTSWHYATLVTCRTIVPSGDSHIATTFNGCSGKAAWRHARHSHFHLHLY
jgi:hypothetical protein